MWNARDAMTRGDENVQVCLLSKRTYFEGDRREVRVNPSDHVAVQSATNWLTKNEYRIVRNYTDGDWLVIVGEKEIYPLETFTYLMPPI